MLTFASGTILQQGFHLGAALVMGDFSSSDKCTKPFFWGKPTMV